jgi:hypothetical protein
MQPMKPILVADTTAFRFVRFRMKKALRMPRPDFQKLCHALLRSRFPKTLRGKAAVNLTSFFAVRCSRH